jgi:hypothetical protein
MVNILLFLRAIIWTSVFAVALTILALITALLASTSPPTLPLTLAISAVTLAILGKKD